MVISLLWFKPIGKKLKLVVANLKQPSVAKEWRCFLLIWLSLLIQWVDQSPRQQNLSAFML
jgi:hypothetical protein